MRERERERQIVTNADEFVRRDHNIVSQEMNINNNSIEYTHHVCDEQKGVSELYTFFWEREREGEKELRKKYILSTAG